MPIIKWNVKAKDVDNAEVREGNFTPYDGPIPSNGTVLLCDVKWVRATKFKSGNFGITMLLVAADNEGKKEQYNGLPMWERISDIPEADWKIRQFMDAIGGTGKDWEKTNHDGSEEKNITNFGSVKTEGLQIEVVTERGKNQEGEPRAEVARFVALNEESDYDSDDDSDNSEAPF